MKTKLLIFATAIIVCLIALTGCKKHECFGEGEIWFLSFDETEHWKECNCKKRYEVAEHDLGEWVIKKYPNEYEAGYKQRACSGCNYIESEELEKLEHEHTFSDKLSYNANGHFYFATCIHYSLTKDMEPHSYTLIDSKAATCTEKGVNTYGCICGYKYTEEIDFLEHEYQDDICINCNNPIPCDNLKFLINTTNDGYYVLGLKNTTEEIIVIPNKYEGLKVIGISPNAFRNNTTVKKIVLSPNITSIGSYSFAGCYKP